MKRLLMTLRAASLLTSVHHLINVKMNVSRSRSLTVDVIKRRLLASLPLILNSRAINNARSNLHEAMILLRLRRLDHKMYLLRKRSIISVHSTRNVSTLYIITGRACVLLHRHRLTRSRLLRAIHILMLIRRSMIVTLLPNAASNIVITRRALNRRRRIIRIRNVNHTAALTMNNMRLVSLQRPLLLIIRARLLIINVTNNVSRIILNRKSTLICSNKLMRLLIGAWILSSNTRRAL